MTDPRDSTGDGSDILTPKGRSWLMLLVGLLVVVAVVVIVVNRDGKSVEAPDAATTGEAVAVPLPASDSQSSSSTSSESSSTSSQSTSQSSSQSSSQSTSRSPSTTIDINGCMSLLKDLTVDTIPTDDLPPEAFDTLAFIVSGPPYPYKADGSVFQNREQLLPIKERGYYREFTVVTPGSSDRGARRIVAGECGERWYTDDHYSSFRLIEGP